MFRNVKSIPSDKTTLLFNLKNLSTSLIFRKRNDSIDVIIYNVK